MQQIRVEPATKTKFRIYLDGEFAFVLYKSELARYGIKDGGEISDEMAAKIKEETVLKRARVKALKLLGDMDRTRAELKDRLMSSDFTEEIAELALAYADSFGYLNDERYVENYVRSRKETKSRREICAELSRKKVDREIVERVLEDCYGADDSCTAILKLLKKRHYDAEQMDQKEKQKICAWLARKGFRYGEIRKAMELPDWED
ncbi:hypothetical protein B5F37_12570 [Drancourtella sp. An210]|nr:hypothetical protein B5F37_12570 [Drancourtella sp. An210]